MSLQVGLGAAATGIDHVDEGKLFTRLGVDHHAGELFLGQSSHDTAGEQEEQEEESFHRLKEITD